MEQKKVNSDIHQRKEEDDHQNPRLYKIQKFQEWKLQIHMSP